MAIIWPFTTRGGGPSGHLRETQAAARTLGIELQSLEVRSPAGLEHAFNSAVSGRAKDLPGDGGLALEQPSPVVQPAADLPAHVIAPGRGFGKPVKVLELGQDVGPAALPLAQAVDKSP